MKSTVQPYSKIHRWRSWTQHLRRQLGIKGQSLYKLSNGDSFVLHAGDNMSDLVFMGRDYEPLESAFCRRLLRPGDVAFDIGANIGYFTALFSRSVGETGLVVAFEPGYRTYRLLTSTIETLRLVNATALPVALWRRSELLSFHSSLSGDDAQQSVGKRDKMGTDAVLLPVPGVSFDELMATPWFSQRRCPTLLKIDVEGAEPQVLEGMAAFLDQSASLPAMLVEYNAEALRSVGNDPLDMIRLLTPRYELLSTPLCWPPWHATGARFTPFDTSAAALPNAELNVLAVPRTGSLRERVLQALP